ncbi:hypothetical protein CORC01_13679 [Colletotrichum orchidophilum]|uniref:Secreted protein n=1 Tax=Colletotrichum orchidophilum TaxID=1209926 RepID=A0A1G4APL3_9PEZI|nr:uncharacterized protein CORC01_13679 [Colletotrichum orchidophilum]OHE91025.1 hypothetical protein CORC01_13679 [Colletotrichum orchidophilum]
MYLSFPHPLPHLFLCVFLVRLLPVRLRFASTSSSNLSVERRLHFDGEGQDLARSEQPSRVTFPSSPYLSRRLVILQCSGMDWLALPSSPIRVASGCGHCTSRRLEHLGSASFVKRSSSTEAGGSSIWSWEFGTGASRHLACGRYCQGSRRIEKAKREE